MAHFHYEVQLNEASWRGLAAEPLERLGAVEQAVASLGGEIEGVSAEPNQRGVDIYVSGPSGFAGAGDVLASAAGGELIGSDAASPDPLWDDPVRCERCSRLGHCSLFCPEA